jgi:hypothetical protein
MRIFIERDGKFYEYDGFDETDCTNEYIETPIRDFPVGSQVNFEGIGWCEIVDSTKCPECVYCDESCEDRVNFACSSYERSDNKSVIARRV